MSDLRYTEVETDLRDSVRGLLEQRSPASRVLSLVQTDPFDPRLWRVLAGEMGLAGMAVPERFGGGGASLREAAVVLEELGRFVAPVPFLSSAVVATTTLIECEAADLIGKLAAGESVAVLAVPLSTPSFAVPAAALSVAAQRISGVVTSVADALAADLLLVFAGEALFAVDATAEGVDRTPVVSLDLTRPLADVRFDGAAGALLATGAGARAAVEAGLTAGAALLASEQLGVGEWCLQTTVDYLKGRYQFGRPVGSFQALKHRLADVWVDLTQARAVARYAAGCAATGDADLPVAASLAQAFCAPVAVRSAEECVQLHGGIGFTWEHPAHLYLKRAKTSAVAFGRPDQHRQRLAALVDLPA